MTAFILKRVAWMAITLWVVYTISFILMRNAPGGPFASERALDPVIEANMRARYNLDDPLFVQYFRELGNILRGDFGMSYRLADFSVNEIIAAGLPISASLGVMALSFALLLGVLAGVTSAVFRGSVADVGLMSLATVGIAAPNFLIASIAIIVFAFYWPVLPAAGWGSWRQLILPSICLGLPYAADIARLTRTGMLDVLSQDYIRTARAKGLSQRVVIFRHALRASLLAVVSFLGPAIAGIVTGSLVIEQIFAIPGIGAHFVQAALQRDYTIAMGVGLLYTALVYVMNLIVDICYAGLDPRVKLDS